MSDHHLLLVLLEESSLLCFYFQRCCPTDKFRESLWGKLSSVSVRETVFLNRNAVKRVGARRHQNMPQSPFDHTLLTSTIIELLHLLRFKKDNDEDADADAYTYAITS